MATTSPDNLRTPNAGDQYALTQDLGALADTVQAALVKRANLYVGTSTQRTAFTTAPEGVHWQDTNGTKKEYVRQGGAWVDWLGVDTGWVNLVLKSGFTTGTGDEVAAVRRIRDAVYFKGTITRTAGPLPAGNTVAADLPGTQFTPISFNRQFASSYSSTTSNMIVAQFSAANVAITFFPVGASSNAVYLGGINYLAA